MYISLSLLAVVAMYLCDCNTSTTFVSSATSDRPDSTIWPETAKPLSDGKGHKEETTNTKFNATARIPDDVTDVMCTSRLNSKPTGQEQTDTHTLGMEEETTKIEMDQTTKPTGQEQTDTHTLGMEEETTKIEMDKTTCSPESDKKTWEVAVERVQFVMASFGYIANIVTLVSLVRNGQFFNKPFCLLLKHQSLVDSGVCLMAGIVLMQPLMWTTGVVWFDAIVCQTWHTQALFWFAVFLSVWNLLFISGERYLAVCMPFSHGNFTLKRAWYAVVLLYPLGLIAGSLGFMQYHFNFDKDECITEYMIRGQLGDDVFYVYSITCMFNYFLIPIVAYVIMYSRILYTIKMRTKNTKLTSSKVIARASDSLTKAAIALTAIFIISIGYDLWYYTLGQTGVVTYELNNIVQKVGVFLAVFNCCINPCVYGVLIPAYRKSFKKTFMCAGGSGKSRQHGTVTNETQSGMSITI